ncbi:hypothetical protein C8J55DRAFT_490165 [Lentinula edodes]|uniref:Uncharacterized protein n=1 Tax=Lentinula lateritia TaxID=40482 RepID=A0A9W9A7Y0_9AGAR|nr:hypothetical protein C8J55DRAFT_490165 [Lentinula edodes]
MNYTSYYPSPPPYGQFAAQWYHHRNQGGFENTGPGPTGPNITPQGGGTVAPSQNQNQNDSIQHEVTSLREELAQMRAEQARNNRRPLTPPPRYNRYQDRTPYPSHHDRPLRRNRAYENDARDQGYDNDRRLYERDNRDRLHDRERDRGYNRYERHIQDQHRESRSNNGSSQANQPTHNTPPAPSADRSLSTSTHAPTVPTTTANLQLPTPPPIHTITTATSPHEPSINNQFEDLMYVTRDEKIAATSLLLYGPSDDLHEDCMWDSSTGACVLVGNSLRQIQERNGPIVLPPPNPDMGNPIMDANPDSAVAAAEARMDEAHQPGNFNALWVAREMAWQAQRTLHQEQDLGILRERSTLPALLTAHLQIFNERKIAWVDKPDITFEGEPWNTEQDRSKPDVPSFPTPDLNESTETWALWCLVHANIRDHPGITWTHSGFVDLATVQMHLILHRLIRGIFGTVDFYTERVRTAKKNFTNHFIDIVAIPDLYGQKLSELDIVVNGAIDFKASASFFEHSNDVVKHLADCGITVDDMAEGFAYGQQLICDKMQVLNVDSKEYRRYINLSKRARARLQFTHIIPIEGRTWRLPNEWTMDNIIEHRRRKLIQAEYRNLHVRKRDAWRFARSGPVLNSTPGISTLNQLAQGVNSLRI